MKEDAGVCMRGGVPRSFSSYPTPSRVLPYPRGRRDRLVRYLTRKVGVGWLLHDGPFKIGRKRSRCDTPRGKERGNRAPHHASTSSKSTETRQQTISQPRTSNLTLPILKPQTSHKLSITVSRLRPGHPSTSNTTTLLKIPDFSRSLCRFVFEGHTWSSSSLKHRDCP